MDRPTGQHRVDLVEHPCAGVGVQGHQVPEPRQRIGRGLVAGEQEGEGLVAHALARPGLALCIEHHVQQVDVLGGVRDALVGDRVDAAVQARHDMVEHGQGRRGWLLGERDLGKDRPHRRGEGPDQAESIQ